MKRLFLVSGTCLILFIISCSPGNRVTLVDSNLSDTLDIFQNLVFDFSHGLAPDSVLGIWDSTAYVGIEPAVKGVFKWSSSKQLVFSPAAGFKPATNYKINLSTALLKYSSGTLNLEAQEIGFSTGALQIKGIQTWWTLSPGSTDKLTLNATLHFNYDIDPSSLAQLLSVEINGKSAVVAVGDQPVSKSLQIRTEGIERGEALNGQIIITINKGLKCTECTEVAPLLTYSAPVNPVSSLEITSTETTFENGEGIIRLYTNQPVIPNDLEKLIAVEPSPIYRVETMESGILLRGGFSAGSSYSITINKNLQGVLGGTFGNDYYSDISFGEQEPGIGFVNTKGMYLTSKGSRKIALQIVNIPKIKVSIYKIYENNILAFMNNNRYEDWQGEENGYSYVYNDYEPERYGNKIMDQEYEVKDLPRQNGQSLLSLNFDDELPFKGIYLISARSSENNWMKATKLVSVSDIGLIARTGTDQIIVFANSVKEATPLQHLNVNIISSNNQVLFSGKTNDEGMVKFTGLKERFGQFKPALITAKSGNDYNYMLLSDTRVETSRFETGGYRENDNGYMAFIYGDREIYRPGETMNFNAVVRNRDWKAMKNMPVKFKLVLPNGREFSTQGKTLNAQGASTQDFKLPAGTVTGTYTLELYAANDILLSSKAISVEEFMPDRISVKATTNKAQYAIGDSVKLSAMANNLFGTAAAGRNYEIQFNLSKTYFQPKGYEGFNFGIRGIDHINFPAVFKQGKTGNDGSITESLFLDPMYRETGKLQGKAFVTVFDETGRPVNRVAAFDVETQAVYYGSRTSEYYAGVGQSLQLGLIALNNKGQAVASTARIRIIKINYHNVLQRDYGNRLYYVSQREEKVLQDRQVNIGNSELVIPFTPNESGEYVMRVSAPGSDRFIQQDFYAYGWGFTGSNSFAVNTEGTIDIGSDKESYSPGENARFLFKTPFNGKLLITVEQNEVLKYYYINTDKKAAELVLPITKDLLPNVYITATLFRKADDGSIPLTVAHGVIPVMVEEKNNKIPLTITAAEKSRSNTKQVIQVKTTPGKNVELTIAVVDEGILQLRNSKTPDPYEYFYQKRSLAVESYNLYPYLLPDIKQRRSSSGGDGYDLAKRVNPITNKRVKLVSAWSGLLKTNASGIASYTMDIPSFSGDLRVMAVAYQDNAFGSAEAHIKVADPIVISSSLPRFTSPGDTVYVPVTFSNTTKQLINATLQPETEGQIKIVNTPNTSIRVEPGKEERILYKVVAGALSGTGSFTMKVKNGNESYRDKTEITIRPPASLQKQNGSGSIKGGAVAEINMKTGFIPSSASAELYISKSPLVNFADHLNYLLDYPHGCAEQTISTAFPQIYFADLAKTISNKPGYTINVQTNVQAGISKIISLQHYNGGIVTWPGSSMSNNWTSVYAAHFLTEAAKAGYQVNAAAMEKLLKFLQKNIKEKNTEEIWYYDSSNKTVIRKSPAKDIFYSLYVLALNNKADKSSMNYYKSKFKELAIDSKYLLACTYLAIGDRKTYNELLPKAFEGERSISSTGGSFYSYIRDMAMALNALLHSDPDHPQVGELVRNLSKELEKNSWMNTQERALSFLALGKFSKKVAQSTITANLTTEGGKPYSFDGKDLIIRKGLVNNKVNITTNGNGNLYYFWTSSGLTSDGSFLQEDKILKVRKTFYSRTGQEITGNSFKQNDLIVVKIALENNSRTFVENVVVTDLLPAGFEIENPRVSSIPDLDWIKNNSASEYIDMRDDRINIYTSIGQQPQYYYYVVRAVSPGNYVMGPVSADAMYSGEYHSIHGAGRIIVSQ